MLIAAAIVVLLVNIRCISARALLAPSNSTNALEKTSSVPNIAVTGLPGGDPHGDFLPSFRYLGGPLIRSPVITTLAWGGGKNGKAVRNWAAVNSFLADLPNTKYMKWINKEYNVPKYVLKGGHFERELVIAPPFKATVTDEDIQKTLKQLVKQKVLPRNTFGNALTVVFLPSGVSVSLQASQLRSCIDLCAYNSAFQLNGKSYYYSVIPDQECAGIKNALDCKKELSLVDATTTAISYAYVAAKTNPEAAGSGWISFHDNGDLGIPCTGLTDRITGPTGVTWTVQQVWSDKDRTCRTEPGRPTLVKGLYN